MQWSQNKYRYSIVEQPFLPDTFYFYSSNLLDYYFFYGKTMLKYLSIFFLAALSTSGYKMPSWIMFWNMERSDFCKA